MAARKMTVEQREHHLLKVSDMYLAGRWQYEIATACGVSRQQIGYDIKLLNTRWKESQLANLDEKKLKEIAKIDNLERVYFYAWEKSCQDAESRTNKTVQADAGNRIEFVHRVDGQVGDAQFLAGVRWCIEQRCKILCLIAPLSSMLPATSTSCRSTGPP